MTTAIADLPIFNIPFDDLKKWMWLRLIHFFYGSIPGWIPLSQFPAQMFPLIAELPARTRDLPVKLLPIDLFPLELITAPNSFLVDSPQICGNGTKRTWGCFEPPQLRMVAIAFCLIVQHFLGE